MLNQYFDQIYLINLDRRTDRLEAVTKELNKFNISFKRIRGIDTSSLGISGAIGCHQSHYVSLLNAYSHNYERVLILEDDIEFTEYFNGINLNKISQHPWDMLYFGVTLMQQPIFIDEDFIRITKGYAAHAIGFTRKMIKFILDHKEAKEIPIDVVYSHFQRSFDCLAYRYPLIIQRKNQYSDIEKRIVNYNFDSI